MFSKLRPFAETMRLTSKFVLPQLDGPAMMHRIEFGNSALCLFVASLFTDDGSQALLPLTGISIDCLLNRILIHTNSNHVKFDYKKTPHTEFPLSIVETLQWHCIRRELHLERRRPLSESNVIQTGETVELQGKSMENHSRQHQDVDDAINNNNNNIIDEIA